MYTYFSAFGMSRLVFDFVLIIIKRNRQICICRCMGFIWEARRTRRHKAKHPHKATASTSYCRKQLGQQISQTTWGSPTERTTLPIWEEVFVVGSCWYYQALPSWGQARIKLASPQLMDAVLKVQDEQWPSVRQACVHAGGVASKNPMWALQYADPPSMGPGGVFVCLCCWNYSSFCTCIIFALVFFFY